MTTKAFLLLLSAAIFLPLNLHADNATKKDITVLITGANRGLGLEMVKQFAADGYKVIGTARKPEKATDLNPVFNSEILRHILKHKFSKVKNLGYFLAFVYLVYLAYVTLFPDRIGLICWFIFYVYKHNRR